MDALLSVWAFVMTPFHELGHVAMGVLCLAPTFWEKWNQTRVIYFIPGQFFMVSLAGYLAETGVFVVAGYWLRKTKFWWIVYPYIGFVAYTRVGNLDTIPDSEWLMWLVWYASDIIAIGLVKYWRWKWAITNKNIGNNKISSIGRSVY